MCTITGEALWAMIVMTATYLEEEYHDLVIAHDDWTLVADGTFPGNPTTRITVVDNSGWMDADYDGEKAAYWLQDFSNRFRDMHNPILAWRKCRRVQKVSA